MLNALLGVKLYAQCYTRSEAICSLLYAFHCFKLFIIHGVKLRAHCYAWSEALCSILYWNAAFCSLLYME